MNKSPETYEELIRQKRCVELTKYYDLTAGEVDKIYNFLEANPKGIVKGGADNLSLMIGNNVIETIMATCTTSTIDGLSLGNSVFTIIPHYTPSSGGSSSGGSSSNNNNNNNNNNR